MDEQGLELPCDISGSFFLVVLITFQCFDAVGWVAGRASSL